jgi:hypothetical protein
MTTAVKSKSKKTSQWSAEQKHAAADEITKFFKGHLQVSFCEGTTEKWGRWINKESTGHIFDVVIEPDSQTGDEVMQWDFQCHDGDLQGALIASLVERAKMLMKFADRVGGPTEE